MEDAMFTGLIQQTGRVEEVRTGLSGGSLAVRAGRWSAPLEIGESIAVQGVCLTLTACSGDVLRFDVLNETLQRTNLGEKKAGSLVNLERALRMGDAVGGHFVAGHVDGTGRIEAVDSVGRDRTVCVACDRELLEGMVVKGSIALDGISLTLVEVGTCDFTVHIIPRTWAETSLATARRGDRVNLETDMIGKYVARYLAGARAAGGLTMDHLKKAGFIGA